MPVTIHPRPRRKLALTKPTNIAPADDIIEIEDDAADPLARQRRYVSAQEAMGTGLGLIFADAFIRGMREIGYKDPAWALAELIDNSYQAGADTVDIRFKDVDPKAERSKPSQIALLDNGIGMISKMISHAVRWGGTDRENDRKGFGRYGYGLPSAAVSLAKRYSVYSKTEGKKWYAVHVDLEELSKNPSDAARADELLKPVLTDPPLWLLGASAILSVGKMTSGTIVVLEELDRLQKMGGWISAKALQAKLLQRFGMIYRHTLQDKKIIVAGAKTEVIDPLFLMPSARYIDETSVRAKQVPTAAFEMEGSVGTGVVRIRAAVLPPNFQLANPDDYTKPNGGTLARRHDIMRASNGILVCRAGRQIDVVSPDWTKFQNYDLNLKIEIDFDPTLDEFFGLTTSKQQIVIDEAMWEKLKQSGKNAGGLQALVKEMRAELKRMRSKLNAKPPAPEDEGPRPSAAAMQAAQKFKPRSSVVSPIKTAEAEAALATYASELAKTRDIPLAEAKAVAKKETKARQFDVEFAARDEAPMYQVRRLGEQKRLVINTAHPFYDKIYQRAGEGQAGVELLLFVLADLELDAEGERETFYKAERKMWSENLGHALNALISDDDVADRASAASEDD